MSIVCSEYGSILGVLVLTDFLLECTLGHRITDILRIDQRLEHIGNKHYITISPKKTSNKRIEVDIIFDIAKKILIDKYKG